MEHEKILRMHDVVKTVGLGITSIETLVKAGQFPAPIAIGARAKGWLSSEVQEWLRQRIALSRDGTTGRLDAKTPSKGKTAKFGASTE